MNAEQFFRLVESMRSAQKDYFKTRNSGKLTESKLLEKQVDDEIKRVNNIITEKK